MHSKFFICCCRSCDVGKYIYILFHKYNNIYIYIFYIYRYGSRNKVQRVNDRKFLCAFLCTGVNFIILLKSIVWRLAMHTSTAQTAKIKWTFLPNVFFSLFSNFNNMQNKVRLILFQQNIGRIAREKKSSNSFRCIDQNTLNDLNVAIGVRSIDFIVGHPNADKISIHTSFQCVLS